MYVPYLNGIAQGPGFLSRERAIQFFRPLMPSHRTAGSVLVIGYLVKDEDGTRSQYYDWVQDKWISMPLEHHGAWVYVSQKKAAG